MSAHWGRGLARTVAVLVVAVASSSAVAQEASPPADAAARSAAMGQIKPPSGTGGWILLALPMDLRREAILQAASGKSFTTPAFQAAVEQATPKCTTRPYARSDSALIGGVVSAVHRSSSALLLTQFGLGQPRLDEAWAGASAEDKAPFYAAADEFLGPGMTVTPRSVPTAPFAARAGLAAGLHQRVDPTLRIYLLFTAISERAETVLAPQAKSSAN